MMESREHAPQEISSEEIASYYEEMLRSNLLELEIETPQGKIVLKRVQARDARSHPMRRKSDASGEDSGSAQVSAPLPGFQGKTISSPIIGVFYRSSSPSAPSFVKEGDTVNAGTTLCIVEAMKVMNEIKADSHYRILKILIENGKPVSKGQALFNVEPA